MKSNFFTALIALNLLAAAASAQSGLSLADLEGDWSLDGEKSYSKSERSDISSYTLKISLSDQTVRLFWDYTIKKKRSNYSQTLIVDGESHDARDYGGMGSGARSYSTRIKRNTLKQSMSYGTSRPTFGSYMDSRTFILSEDKNTLTIETLFISARPGDSFNQGKQRLVFSRSGVRNSAS